MLRTLAVTHSSTQGYTAVYTDVTHEQDVYQLPETASVLRDSTLAKQTISSVKLRRPEHPHDRLGEYLTQTWICPGRNFCLSNPANRPAQSRSKTLRPGIERSHRSCSLTCTLLFHASSPECSASSLSHLLGGGRVRGRVQRKARHTPQARSVLGSVGVWQDPQAGLQYIYEQLKSWEDSALTSKLTGRPWCHLDQEASAVR